jgi:sterol 3beta-glucosyltransferase
VFNKRQPVPIKKLKPERLAKAFIELRSEEMQIKAQAMSAAFAKEDGVKAGLEAFYKHLPVEDMVCDVR